MRAANTKMQVIFCFFFLRLTILHFNECYLDNKEELLNEKGYNKIKKKRMETKQKNQKKIDLLFECVNVKTMNRFWFNSSTPIFLFLLTIEQHYLLQTSQQNIFTQN